MKLLLAVEHHYRRGPDQHVCADGPSAYARWANYLEAFEQLVLLGRMGTVNTPCPVEARADGPSVLFAELPDYYGPWQYLSNLRELVRRVRRSVEECDAYILRVPGLIGRLAWKEIRRLKHPYALEVLGDPWDALGPKSVRMALRPVFRRTAVRNLRAMCQGAVAVHYVTRSLQDRYPAAQNAYSTQFPDALVEGLASETALEAKLRRFENADAPRQPLRVGFVGSLAQLYKGLDVLLRAASICCSRNLQLQLRIAGDGRYAGNMKLLAKKLALENQTEFLGQLTFGKEIFDLLDSIDLFVLPSYAEGLPRALFEAMARGCPCIGTNIGGIPELLAPEDIVPAGDANALAEKIIEVCGSGSRLRSMAQRNFAEASQFSPAFLAKARSDFCWFVRRHVVRGSEL
jgi:glycosyltransferase involved in cell wall biosynthesis